MGCCLTLTMVDFYYMHRANATLRATRAHYASPRPMCPPECGTGVKLRSPPRRRPTQPTRRLRRTLRARRSSSRRASSSTRRWWRYARRGTEDSRVQCAVSSEEPSGQGTSVTLCPVYTYTCFHNSIGGRVRVRHVVSYQHTRLESVRSWNVEEDDELFLLFFY